MNKTEFVKKLSDTANALNDNSLILRGKAIAYQEIADMLQVSNIEFHEAEPNEDTKESE